MQSEMAYVYKVFQEKSFTKAAEELFMTQPRIKHGYPKSRRFSGYADF